MVGRRCVVPGCGNAYSLNSHISLFSVPRNPAHLEEWRKCVPRKDSAIKPGQRVCEVHFEKRFVVRVYEHTVNGEIVSIPRDRPCLTVDAVPSLYLNLPKNVTKISSMARVSPLKQRTGRRACKTIMPNVKLHISTYDNLSHTFGGKCLPSTSIPDKSKQSALKKQIYHHTGGLKVYRSKIKSLRTQVQNLSKTNTELQNKIRKLEGKLAKLP